MRPIKITFLSLSDTWSNKDANITKTLHYTPFHGFCTSFYISEEQPIKTTAEFTSDSKTPLAMYLLTHPEEMLPFMFYGNFPTTTLVEINTQALVEVNYKSFEMLNTEANPCWENVEQSATTNCLINLMEKQITNQNYTCVPPALESILPSFKDKMCQDSKANEGILAIAYNLTQYEKLEQYCKFVCKTRQFGTARFPVAASKQENAIKVYVRITSAFEEVTTENYIHTPLSILTSTGGALGMFLGWSVYQNYLDWVEFVTMVLVKLNILKSK